jgi:electron transfer flavoprotein beta subunit
VGYDCIVCAKQVPDTKRITGEAMKEDGTVNRAALPAIFNPEDRNALEAALGVRDAHGGTVTLISMGPPSAAEVLREGLFRGVDRAILLTDRRAAVSDTHATSYILSCAIRRLPHDIVFCGRQAIDGDTAQVGPQLAEKLGITQITYLEEPAVLEGRTIRARRNVGSGFELVQADLPVLVTVMESANTPRPPAARRMMKYKKARTAGEVARELGQETGEAAAAAEVERRCQVLAEKGLLIETWDLGTIEADLAWCGRLGSPTKVHRVQWVKLAGGEYREFPATDEGVRELVTELIEEHTFG